MPDISSHTKKTYSLGDQARYLFLAKIITFAFQFLTPVILTRLFTVGDYGIYRQILVFAVLFPQILNLGLPNSLFYYFPILKDAEKRKQLMSQTFYWVMFIGIAFLVIFLPFQKSFFQLFKLDYDIAPYVIPVSLLIVFTLTALTLENLFIVEQRSDRVMIYTILNGFLRFVLIVAAVLLFKRVDYQIWALVLSELLRTLFLYIYLKVKYQISFKGIDKSFSKEQFRYSLPMGIGNAISTFGGKMETYVMLLFLSPLQFAVYSVANFRLPYVNMLYGSIANVAMLRISEFAQQQKNEDSRLLWHKVIIQQAAITIPSVIFFIAMAQPFILLLFTAKYTESIPVFRIILLAPLAQVLSSMIILRCYNENRYALRINIATFIFSIAASYLLIKYWGLIGAAIAGVLNFYFTVFLETRKAMKILKLSIKKALPYREFLIITSIALAISIPIYFINYLPVNNLVKLALGAILFFIPSLYLYQRLNLIDTSFIGIKMAAFFNRFK